MRTLLITGGTVFVSRYAAEYFAQKGNRVFVLNRGSRPQPQHPNITPIVADRHALGGILKTHTFDAVLDLTAYTRADVQALLNGLGRFEDYILLSSSAVYPETAAQPFAETTPCGPNLHWGAYGTNKLAAEQYLAVAVPHAYILRPPYLYGPQENLYRSPYIFDCITAGRPVYLPGDGSLKLQFFHVRDLCRFMERLLEQHPARRIYNLGNPQPVTAQEWVQLCGKAAGRPVQTIGVDKAAHPAYAYFPFRDYEYQLDVTAQATLLPTLTPLADGLAEEYSWYRANPAAEMRRKPYFDYISREIDP
ncbi:MAG: NAD-dependent epimerase/dehydratase family protein [Faecalibacterium sp.]|nr:NAD-dependent epimerase/dehydratase family protein [Faecalibacterium sp.]